MAKQGSTPQGYRPVSPCHSPLFILSPSKIDRPTKPSKPPVIDFSILQAYVPLGLQLECMTTTDHVL